MPASSPGLIKLPHEQRLPENVTLDEAARQFAATRVLSCRVFIFTLCKLGLRQGEGPAILAPTTKPSSSRCPASCAHSMPWGAAAPPRP